MALRISIGDVTRRDEGIWATTLSGAEVRRLGEPKSQLGSISIIAVDDASYAPGDASLSFDPSVVSVLNIGTSNDALIIAVGLESEAVRQPMEPTPRRTTPPPPTSYTKFKSGDSEFLRECERMLIPELASWAKVLLMAVREHHPGEMREGKARKWVNHPQNFIALTIQNRDQSFAVHVKGIPDEFDAPTLNIKRDRGSYSRFKLEHANQLKDTIRVILQSASRN
jgi:hypothetical protein